MGRCVICEHSTSGSLEFCKNCYNSHKEDITQKEPWTRALKNDAQKERRRREKEFNDVSLDSILDRQYERAY